MPEISSFCINSAAIRFEKTTIGKKFDTRP